jgi:hypothetical protein
MHAHGRVSTDLIGGYEASVSRMLPTHDCQVTGGTSEHSAPKRTRSRAFDAGKASEISVKQIG